MPSLVIEAKLGAGADRYSSLRRGLGSKEPHLLLHAGFNRRFPDVPKNKKLFYKWTQIRPQLRCPVLNNNLDNNRELAVNLIIM